MPADALGWDLTSWFTRSPTPTKAYLRGAILDTPRAAFLQAMTFPATLHGGLPARIADDRRGGSLLTMTYMGAEKWVPHYNAMGVPGRARGVGTLHGADLAPMHPRQCHQRRPNQDPCASGIGDFRYILRLEQLNSPMQRNVTIRGRRGRRLPAVRSWPPASPATLHHVDCGYSLSV